MAISEGNIVLNTSDLSRTITEWVQKETTRKTNIKKVLTELSTIASESWFSYSMIVDKMANRNIPDNQVMSGIYTTVNGIVLVQNEKNDLLLTHDGVFYNSYKSANRTDVASLSIPVVSRRGPVNEFTWVAAPFQDHVLFDDGGLLSKSEELVMGDFQQSIDSFKEVLAVAFSQSESA